MPPGTLLFARPGADDRVRPHGITGRFGSGSRHDNDSNNPLALERPYWDCDGVISAASGTDSDAEAPLDRDAPLDLEEDLVPDDAFASR